MAKTKFLLDTHIFIWWMEGNRRLSNEILELLNNHQSQIFISLASVWEIVIKQAKKKLKVPRDIERGVRDSNFTVLQIKISHVLHVKKLPRHHNDPFDRMLVAQAKVENCSVITTDPKIKKYKVPIIG